MSFTIYSDERHKWLYQPETTFGTAIAMSSTGFKELIHAKAEFPSFGVTHDFLPINRSSRVLALTDIYTDNFSGPATFSLSLPVSLDRVADLVYMVTQNRVSLAGTTPYQKVYRPHASQPDFTANAGWFGTFVWVPLDQTAASVRFTSCVARSLTLNFSKEGTGVSNIVQATINLVAKKVEVNQNYTGSSAAQGSNWINPYSFTAALTLPDSGGDTEIASANWRRFTLTLDNGATAVDKDTDGTPKSWFLNPDRGYRASLGLWYDTDTKSALYSLRQGSIVTLTVSKGSAGVAGYYNVATKGIITTDPLSSSGAQMHMNLDLQLGNSTASGTDGCTLTIADAISQ